MSYLGTLRHFTITRTIAYSIIIAPLSLAFPENFQLPFWAVLDYVFDFVFILDLFLRFFQAFYDAEGNLVIKHRKIAKNYLQGWFLIDFFSAFPFGFIAGVSTNGSPEVNTYIRLTKAMKVYRLKWIFKIPRIRKLYGDSSDGVSVQRKIRLNETVERLLASFLTCFATFHIISCLWLIVGKLEEEPTSWIYRLGFADASMGTKYFACFYWTIQTVLTVGSGDFPCYGVWEKVFATFWMFCGVFIYSFLIGSVSSLIAGVDAERAENEKRLGILRDIVARYKLPRELYNKIKQAVMKYRNKDAGYEQLMGILPMNLREEVTSIREEYNLETGGLLEFFRFLIGFSKRK